MTKKSRTCSISGCGKIHEAKGFCHSHYHRFKRYGDPLEMHRKEKRNGLFS